MMTFTFTIRGQSRAKTSYWAHASQTTYNIDSCILEALCGGRLRTGTKVRLTGTTTTIQGERRPIYRFHPVRIA